MSVEEIASRRDIWWGRRVRAINVIIGFPIGATIATPHPQPSDTRLFESWN